MKKPVNTVTGIVFAVALTGCATGEISRVPDAEGEEIVSAAGMGCDRPFGLVHDCSSWSGPTKEIVIDGVPMKVSGNADGTVAVMFGERSGGSTNTNLGYEMMKRELASRGYTIVRVVPIASMGMLFGYGIETTEPNYEIWDGFAAAE